MGTPIRSNEEWQAIVEGLEAEIARLKALAHEADSRPAAREVGPTVKKGGE